MTAHELLRHMASQPEGKEWVEYHQSAQDTALRLRRRSALDWRISPRDGRGKPHVDYRITARGLQLLKFYDSNGCVTEICKECGGKRSRRKVSNDKSPKGKKKKESTVLQEEVVDRGRVQQDTNERSD